MKKLISPFISFSFVWLFSCCNQETKTVENKTVASQDSTKEMWAEQIQSISVMAQPIDYDDAYWKALNKNVDRQQIFKTIVDAVISGKLHAYNLVTDSLLTIDQVKAALVRQGETPKRITKDDISQVRMREKWVFDKEKLKLEKQVTRIDLLISQTDEAGEATGNYKPLFYVNLNI